jgi:D-alanyl-D-alanine carboxypeptidase
MESISTDFVRDHDDLNTALYLLDKWTAHQVHRTQQPGLALGIVHNGDLIWGRGYGYANLEQKTPVTLTTRFRIASITKSFTATAIMQLYDAGQLRLDDPVSTYLDWFDLRYADAPPITIQHLLTHTSGLPRDATNAHWTDGQFQSWDELVATTQTRQPTMPPLADYSYSNLGYSLLGGVIEVVSGRSWADYVQAHILDPLEMNNSVPAPTHADDQLALGYKRFDDEYVREAIPFFETRGFSPSASMISSVTDLAKYAKFHLSKGQTPILSGYSLRDMHRVHWLFDDWESGYGYGLRIYRIGEHIITGHTGGYQGYLTQFTVCREHDLGVIVLTNSLDSQPTGYTERAYKLVLPEIMAIARKHQQAHPDWQQYVGTYENMWHRVEVVVRHDQLQVISIDALDQAPTTLEPTDQPHTFRIQVPGNPGETVRFERDDAGTVTRMWNRNEYMEPITP